MRQETATGGTARVARSQHTVHTLPRDWPSLAQVLAPSVERIDPLNAATQLLIITPDVESTVALVAGAFAHFGVQGIDIVPATGPARTARLLRTDPARAVAGPPWVLRELVGSSALRLDRVRTVVLAWIDDLIASGGEPLSDVETILGEMPPDAVRVLVVRELGPAVESFSERHLHHARRVSAAGSAEQVGFGVSYVTATAASRPAMLRRILDDLDPPSAVVVVRSEESAAEANRIVRQLGYRREEDVVRVTRGDVPANVNTAILYESPPDAASLEAAHSAQPARIVVLVEPRELPGLRRLTRGRAMPLQAVPDRRGSGRRDEALQEQLRELLRAGFGIREIGAIEPLLLEFDAAEIAGALVRLLERERERVAVQAARGPHPGTLGAQRPPAQRAGVHGGSRGRPGGREGARPAHEGRRDGGKRGRDGASRGGR